ncbi:CHAT domain-containing protein [Leptothoe sp. PORK10 BA2]|uniref:CHAT domain-containing protein n=1 Tax=Leptothoe sp. PORK10 BA2 TaxID=3110254 RepID=UPI002B2041C4|nr:CHAT domain-containing protein [Leptothoe sp. PORK10 BA2]MEA5464204.1 CHAT domain-containing protein [Leptothoe sp. PORK10 BA2]
MTDWACSREIVSEVAFRKAIGGRQPNVRKKPPGLPCPGPQRWPRWISSRRSNLTQSRRANLVVLSAYDTGHGQITGDSVIGLSRSVLAAGAENVMVSPWQVPDDATAQLMIEFYRQPQHLDNAQALRQVLLTTRQQHQNPLHGPFLP